MFFSSKTIYEFIQKSMVNGAGKISTCSIIMMATNSLVVQTTSSGYGKTGLYFFIFSLLEQFLWGAGVISLMVELESVKEMDYLK